MAIKLEKKGKVVYITINRPENMNSLDFDTVKELSDAMIEYRDDDDMRAAVITGAGDKAFCAGMDLKSGMFDFIMKEMVGKPWKLPPSIFRGLEIYKPIIAAINGLALGGGLELALACDLRVASEKAVLGTPEVQLGALPGWGGTQRIVRTVPKCKAAELLLLGTPVDAQEAHRIGLVNKVVPGDKVMEVAEGWANRLSEVAPMSVKTMKELIVRASDMTLDDALRFEWMMAMQLFMSGDIQEGMKAFAEKRKPEFKGK